MTVRRRKRLIQIGVLLAVVVYVIGFYTARKRIHFTTGFGDRLDNWPGYTVYYFSEDSFTNRFLYYAYWPLHCWRGGDVSQLEAGKQTHTIYYSRDWVPAMMYGDPIAYQPTKVDDLPIDNVYQITTDVFSGGEPKGESAFAALAEMEFKTIISVDGAKPEVALAKKHGMRYVHLPHSYDGVPEERAKELAKAVRDLPGPVYIHCHHGKHRSAAAAAVACVGAGLLPASDALAFLETAGTSKSYRGLYQSAESARKLEDELLDELKPDFPETANVPPLADAMVAVERTHDHVKQIAANDWKPLAKHPDIDPAHEVLLLREHYTELLRANDVSGQSAEFQSLMREGETAANALEQAMAEANLSAASQALRAINKNCSSCHQRFRDVPLGEK